MALEFGSLYVHVDEDGNAISVAMNGGKPGAWQGISIARMDLPDDKNKTREQINAFAKLFAEAPKMRDELVRLRAEIEELKQQIPAPAPESE